ncbi:cadherin-like domain-containing protein, partial [Anabaena sp. UHCC 0451]|uniref:cadherin-like domain-containing protein n=1 Tax=Anabaena sp. UHCC 0451 TaxID=2055235 RepID=UPI002B2064B7
VFFENAPTTTPVNNAPTGSPTATLGNTAEDTEITINAADLLTGFSDVDAGDTLSVVNLTADNGVLVDNNDGTYTFTPDANFNGAVNLSYDVTDGTDTLTGQTQTFSVTPVNDAPTGSPTAILSNTAEDTPIIINASDLLAGFSDVESDTLSVVNNGPFRVTATNGTVVNNGNGTYTFTPNLNFNGAATLRYVVTDGQGFVRGTQTFSVTAVNDAPIATPKFITPITNPFGLTDVGGFATPTFADIDGDGDLDAFVGSQVGDTLFYRNTGTATAPTFTQEATNPFGLTDVQVRAKPTLADIDGDGDLDAFVGNIDGNIVFYRNTGTTAAPTFTLEATNPFGLTDVGDFAAPTLADIDHDGDLDAFVGNIDDNIVFYRNTGTAAAPTFTQEATNPFRLTNVGSEIFAAPTLADIDHDGDLDAFVGNRDGNTLFFRNTGTATAPTFTLEATNPFGLTDVGLYAAPTFADIDHDGDLDAFVGNLVSSIVFFENTSATTLSNTTEDTAIIINAADLLTGFSDVEGDTISVVNLTADNGVLVDNNNGTYTFTPTANFNGTVTLSYGVSDGTDTLNGQTQTFSVTPVNDALTGSPTATLSNTAEDTAITINAADLLAGFSDVDAGDTLSVVNLTADNGVLVDNNDGTYTFTPTANFNGAVNLSYDVTDGTDTLTGQTQTFSVTPVNDAPVGSPTATLGNTAEDTAIIINAADLLAGFSDVEGDTLSVTGLTANNGGLVDNGNGTYTFNPTADFNGAVTLDYGVSDGTATLTGQTQTFSVTPVNDAPVGSPTATLGNTAEDTAIIINAADLLTGFSDVDAGDTLSVTGLTADNGGLVDNLDGTYTFTPTANFNGTVTLDYGVSDGTDTLAGQTQTFSVIVPNSLESDYTIFSRNISGKQFTVELTGNDPVYKIDDIAINQPLNDFLSASVFELGGTVVSSGTINENALEHFGGTQNPAITKNTADQVIIRIGGSGVAGNYKADFNSDADADAFRAFAQDLLGTDPTKTKIFQFTGSTNGGSNSINIFTNDEIILLNPDLTDGLRTTDSLDFTWSGADTAGTQVRNNFNDFIGEMGNLFGGNQLMNADIHVIPTLNEAELLGTQVQISNGIGGTEIWGFNTQQEAQNFLTFFDSTVDAFL